MSEGQQLITNLHFDRKEENVYKMVIAHYEERQKVQPENIHV